MMNALVDWLRHDRWLGSSSHRAINRLFARVGVVLMAHVVMERPDIEGPATIRSWLSVERKP